jgi:thiamine biosynthesis lipoprotein
VKPPRSGVNRRDLLRLRTIGAELADPDSPATSRLASAATRDSDLLRVRRPAMGSYFEIRLGARVPGAVELASRALDLIDELEAQMTVYRDDSEVSCLNATAHQVPVAVEPGLFRLLEQAVALSEQTGGAYDVTSGALSEAWGFVRGPRRVPHFEVLAEARACTGWQHLKLDPESQTVAFDRPGVRINLGSIGKGYAIDRTVEVLRNHWFPTSALVHGGQSSLYALGSPPGRFGDRWEIALRNPFEPESPLGRLRLRNRGLGTSGGAFQSFEVDGKPYGHILDPRTGEPARGPASVTVLAPTAAVADALSTAFFLLGPEGAADYVNRKPGIGIIIVEEGMTDRAPRLRTFGIGGQDFQPI